MIDKPINWIFSILLKIRKTIFRSTFYLSYLQYDVKLETIQIYKGINVKKQTVAVVFVLSEHFSCTKISPNLLPLVSYSLNFFFPPITDVIIIIHGILSDYFILNCGKSFKLLVENF